MRSLRVAMTCHLPLLPVKACEHRVSKADAVPIPTENPLTFMNMVASADAASSFVPT